MPGFVLRTQDPHMVTERITMQTCKQVLPGSIGHVRDPIWNGCRGQGREGAAIGDRSGGTRAGEAGQSPSSQHQGGHSQGGLWQAGDKRSLGRSGPLDDFAPGQANERSDSLTHPLPHLLPPSSLFSMTAARGLFGKRIFHQEWSEQLPPSRGSSRKPGEDRARPQPICSSSTLFTNSNFH